MYDSGNDTERPTLAETYAGAVSAGASRPGAHSTKPADLIGAAGMSPYRMGTALMRLVSEWQSGAVPRQGEVPDAKVLAQQAAVARVDSGIQAAEEEYGGMRIGAKADRRAAAVPMKHEAEFAHAEHRRLLAQSTDWNLAEAKLRFQRLKTLPTVRAALLHWVQQKDWENGEQLVAGVLQYFLSPKCPTCGGSGVREFAGNNRRGAGKPCTACRARKDAGQIKVMGEMPIPGHGRGRALLQYLTQCTGQAAHDMREGAHRLHRRNEEDRARQKQREQVEQQQRADVEAQADEAQDNAAVADKFKMGERRPVGGWRRE